MHSHSWLAMPGSRTKEASVSGVAHACSVQVLCGEDSPQPSAHHLRYKVAFWSYLPKKTWWEFRLQKKKISPPPPKNSPTNTLPAARLAPTRPGEPPPLLGIFNKKPSPPRPPAPRTPPGRKNRKYPKRPPRKAFLEIGDQNMGGDHISES